MFEVQQYNQVFEITFPVEIAQQVLGVMESLYGSEFDRVHGKTDADVLIEKMREVLDGITPQQLQKGLELMKSEKWCPTLPGFRLLCLQDHDWWSAEIAWAKALNWDRDKNCEISRTAKRCLDEVRHILNVEGQKAAHRAFADLYLDYVSQAKKAGRVQILLPKTDRESDEYQAKLQAKNKERDRVGIPCPPELAAKIKSLGGLSGGAA